MTLEQFGSQVLRNNSEIARIAEIAKSAHKRIDENDHIISGIHKLAANVEALAMQIKLLTERMENSIERLEYSLKSQGERIGHLEKEPANKWKSLVSQVVAIAAAAVIGGIIGKITGQRVL